MHEYGLQLGIVGGVIYVLRWAQRSSLFPSLRVDTDKLRMLISGMLAFATSVGLVFSFDGYEWVSGGKILITVPAGATLLNAIGHTALSFLGQEAGYTLLKVRDSQTTIAGLLVNLQKLGWLDPDSPKFKVTPDLVPSAPKQTAEVVKDAAIASDGKNSETKD